MHKLFTPSLLICALTACSTAQTPIEHTPTTITTAQAPAKTMAPALQAIVDQSWQLQLSASPEMAYGMGDKSAAGKLQDLSPEALAKLNQGQIAILAQLKALDRSKLSKEDKINAQILEDQIQNEVDLYKYKDYYLPITAESGFHAYISSIAQGRFNTLEDYQNYLGKLKALPTYFAQQTHWLKQGLKEGITPPKATLKGFENSISVYILPVEKSSYFKPFTQYPSHFTEAQKTQLTQEGRASVEQNVLPTYQAFYDFMTQEYMPNTRENIAANSLPDGDAFYENRVRYYTTLNMTSAEVHELGLKEVKRIRQEMEQVIKSVGFKGSFADFLHFLRTDPQFYTTSADQLLKEAAFIAKKADAMLPKYFGKLPRKPYGIAPVPAEIAPKYTSGRYSGSNRDDEPGYYWVNTYALDKRPLYELEALTLHEAVPGHHLQISLNSELSSLPDFRRYSYISAFGEGWGLYSEYLGLEAGFYQDPYSNFGRLTYEMWRAARLVVDTGMHA